MGWTNNERDCASLHSNVRHLDPSQEWGVPPREKTHRASATCLGPHRACFTGLNVRLTLQGCRHYC